MTIPGLLLGTIVGALIGALLHFIAGGHVGRLVLYLLFGVAGFWVGHLIAEILGISILSVGPVHMGLAVIASLGLTGLGYWLSLVQSVKKPTPKN